MSIQEISIRRPIFAWVLNILIILIGIVAFTKLPLREFPDIDPPIVSVETLYIGAAADVVESRITQVLEDSISGIEGIKSIESKSADGLSTITIEFSLDRKVDEAANDVRDRVSRVSGTLPDEAENPQISKFDANTEAIFWIALQSDKRDGIELTDYADRYIIDRLSVLNGVARIQIGGERRYAMRIWVNPKELAARNLTIQDLEQALRRENIELPAGRIESLDREFTVRVDRGYENETDFQNMIVKRNEDGSLLRMKDVAKIEKGARDERTELRYNGRSSIGLGIAKQSNANTLDVIRAVKAEMEKIKPTLPRDLIMETAFDSGIFIESAIDQVYRTLIETTLLVVFVIFIFLGSARATLIPAMTIPISMIGALIFLWALGFSINLLTLLALVLAIGLVVDDSIVVLENIYKRIERGEPPLASALMGTNQVAFAVIATTLVLVSVFVPVSLIPGDAGKLFTEFAWAMIGAILFSSFVALSLSPMMCSQLLKTPAKNHKPNPISAFVNRTLESITVRYMNGLDRCFRHPKIIIAFMLAVIALGIFFARFIPSEYTPTEDRGYFLAVMIAPEGSSLEYSKRHMSLVEDKMLKLLPEDQLSGDQSKIKGSTGEANGIVTIVPAGFSSTGAVNGGFSFILLKPWDERERNVGQIIWGDFMKGTPGLFQDFMSIPGIMAFPIQPSSLGQGGFSTPVQFVIGGPNYEELAQWRDLMLPLIQKNEKLRNVDWDYKETKPQIRVTIDQARAGELGVSVDEIGNALQSFFGSREVTTYLDNGEEYDVVIQGQDQDRVAPDKMSNIYVRSATTNQLIPLSNLIVTRESADAAELNRYNRMRAITISANLAPGYTLGQALEFLEQTAQETLPSEAKIDYKGESKDFKDTGFGIYLTFALALLAVYLFLSAQFESWVHPFVIMMTVPLAVVGALWGLFLTGATLNIYTQIGLIMLVGLATKNGILIVEFANQLRDEGTEFITAIKQAAEQRLRPILMTSVATVAGSIPLILAHGAGAESRFPIGVVIFSGVIIATILTLFIVPTFYKMLTRNIKPPHTTGHELEKQLQNHGSDSNA
jgi:multidrug efflux pump